MNNIFLFTLEKNQIEIFNSIIELFNYVFLFTLEKNQIEIFNSTIELFNYVFLFTLEKREAGVQRDRFTHTLRMTKTSGMHADLLLSFLLMLLCFVQWTFTTIYC